MPQKLTDIQELATILHGQMCPLHRYWYHSANTYCDWNEKEDRLTQLRQHFHDYEIQKMNLSNLKDGPWLVNGDPAGNASKEYTDKASELLTICHGSLSDAKKAAKLLHPYPF